MDFNVNQFWFSLSFQDCCNKSLEGISDIWGLGSSGSTPLMIVEEASGSSSSDSESNL